MDYYEKYLKYRNKYTDLKDIFIKQKSLSNRRRGVMNITIIQANNSIDYSDTIRIDQIKNDINKFISDSHITPEFKYGLGDDNIYLKEHINKFFKYKYIESINGIVIANRKHLIQNILNEMNIKIDINSFNTIFLENKIVTIDKKIKKIERILEGLYIIKKDRLLIFKNEINKLIKQRTTILYIIDHINKNFKIFNSMPKKKGDMDGNMKGKNVEDIINCKIKKILSDNINNKNIPCDVMYISNIDYHSMNMGMDKKTPKNISADNMKYKQEIDGMICIKLSNNTWLPIIMLEIKTNINLIYNDINKLNLLYENLQAFENFNIICNNIMYTIVGDGFKNINIYYCVKEIDMSQGSNEPNHNIKFIYNNHYIKFIYNNHYTKRIIYDSVMSSIKSKIDSIELFTDVEELNNYIMNILNGKEYNNLHLSKILVDRNNIIRRDLIDRMMKIDMEEPTYTIILHTVYSNNDFNYFNYDKKINKKNHTIYSFLETIGIITPIIINCINSKINEISENFITFNTRNDTRILYIE